MTEQLTIFSQPDHKIVRNSLAEKVQLAQIMAKSNIIPKISKGQPYSAEDIVSLFLIGERLGVDPIAALSGVWIIEGRPCISARLCRALIVRAGHKWKVKEWDATKIVVEVQRKGDDDWQSFDYTMKEAAHAGVAGKQTWRQHPKPMLMAAVTRRIVDAVFPDLFLGMTAYEAEEFESSTSDVVTIEAQPKKKKSGLNLRKIVGETTEDRDSKELEK